MADKIRANYAAMEEMAKQMDLVKERLAELTNTVLKISQQMDGGVLQGTPGEAFSMALAFLSMKTTILAGLSEQHAQGIRAAKSDMEQADGAAAGDFH